MSHNSHCQKIKIKFVFRTGTPWNKSFSPGNGCRKWISIFQRLIIDASSNYGRDNVLNALERRGQKSKILTIFDVSVFPVQGEKEGGKKVNRHLKEVNSHSAQKMGNVSQPRTSRNVDSSVLEPPALNGLTKLI